MISSFKGYIKYSLNANTSFSYRLLISFNSNGCYRDRKLQLSSHTRDDAIVPTMPKGVSLLLQNTALPHPNLDQPSQPLPFALGREIPATF